jgi:selenocysteine lyase/cysteine desulfurase
VSGALSSAFTPSGHYLDTATYGLAPGSAVAELQAVTAQWAAGTYDPLSCDAVLARARATFARLVDAEPADVAIGHQVSPLVAAVAGSLPPGSRVLAAEGDFTSLLFPFAAAGHELHAVELHRLAEAIDARTDVVAVSAVQSADGRLADLDAITASARAHEALTVLDATQACGWLPLDARRFDVVLVGGYKWLCHPRGTAFMVAGAPARERLRALNAGWYAGEHPWETCYGLPLRQAADARRFDVSPAWFLWHAAASALELLADVGIDRIHDHDLGLANRLRAGLELEPADSAIVSFTADADAGGRLRAAGVRSSVRAGRVRISPHLYNDDADVDRALEALHAGSGTAVAV